MSERSDATAGLLLRCMAGAAGPGELPGGDDEAVWARLGGQALRLGVAPFLYWRLREAGAAVPEATRGRLAAAYWSAATGNLHRLAELDRVTKALAGAAVPVVALKGAALVDSAYPTLGCRPMADLDLLVPAGCARAAEGALEGAGYRAEVEDHLGHSRAFLREFGGELTFFPAGPGGCGIDLHWRLIHHEGLRDTLAIDYEAMWERAERRNGSAGRLAAEDTVLYLALHLALHHRLAELRLFLDVDRVIRAAEVDWAALAGRAAAWRARALTGTVLGLCRELFGTPVPEAALAEMGPSRARRAALSRLVDARRIAEGTVAVGSRGERVLHALLADRPEHVAHTAARALWPGAAWIRARYGVEGRGLWRTRARHVARMAGYGVQAVGEWIGRR